MKRAILCTGVLGGGTALVFTLALIVAVLFPQGALIPASWNGGFARGGLIAPGGGMVVDDVMVTDGVILPAAVPAPVPAIDPPVEPVAVPASIESPDAGG